MRVWIPPDPPDLIWDLWFRISDFSVNHKFYFSIQARVAQFGRGDSFKNYSGASSNLAASTKFFIKIPNQKSEFPNPPACVAQSAEAFDLKSKCWKFESFHAHFYIFFYEDVGKPVKPSALQVEDCGFESRRPFFDLGLVISDFGFFFFKSQITNPKSQIILRASPSGLRLQSAKLLCVGSNPSARSNFFFNFRRGGETVAATDCYPDEIFSCRFESCPLRQSDFRF